MSASLITFANFGRKQNLRTSDMLPVIATFEKRRDLKQIICQIHAGFHFKNTRSAIPPVVRYPMRVLEKIRGKTFPRRAVEKMFDFFAAAQLQFADVTFLQGGHVFPQAVERAHALGSVTVDISASAHVAANAVLEEEEFKILGITGYEGWYTRLAREATPVENMDYRILMSEFTKKTYVDAGYPADRIFIAYSDVDMERFKPAPAARDRNAPFQVLYLAHTQPLKGLHYLLDAWELLTLPHAELLIIGAFADMPPELEQQYLTRMRRDPRITYIAGTHTPEKYLREASVFVFPSLTEGFGRITLEAMASGLPVITTEHATGMVENGTTGYIVPIRDAKALAEKIQYLYDHPEVRERMGKEARNVAETKKPFGESVYEIYQKIMKREGKIG